MRVFLFLGLIGFSFAAQTAFARKMDWDLKEFIAKILHSSVMAPHLNCSVKVKDLRQERRFSSGSRWVEMIEVSFRNSGEFAAPMKTFFAVGSNVTLKTVNSEFGGVVEEISLESGDRLNKTLTFQHDGKGQIVWMEMHDDLRVSACRLRP
ncbi:MAG: hypothetical protein KF789_10235 [Bdellovibrionaceae bacterium]|nr:hypothetical protein [Pseudobdellovibrionaceae bacterium]